MAQYSTNGYPFDSKYSGVSPEGFPLGDRDGSAEDLAVFLEYLMDDGVDSGGLAVTAGTGLTVNIGAGTALIRGRIRKFAEQSLTLTTATTTQVWNILIRLDTDTERRIWCLATSDEPVDTQFAKDLVIAKVTVNANQASIAGVQDTRVYTRTHTAIPRGIISMWSGTIAGIPYGWALCDGQNGTPNLLNRFIVGAGSSYSVGSTGGVETVTLSASQIPSHSHTIQGYAIQNTGTTWMGTTSATNTPNSSSFSTSSFGSGGSHENRPPYFALAYIMKL